MAKKRKNNKTTLEEKVEPIRAAKKILVVEDTNNLEYTIGLSLESLSRKRIDPAISYLRPSKELNKRVLGRRKPDIVITSTRDRHAYILNTARDYSSEIPVLVIATDYNQIEINYAADHGATCVFGPRGSKDYLIEIVADILNGKKVKRITGFDKPRMPENKTGPSAMGFTRSRTGGQGSSEKYNGA